jgi:hypothetical protein
VPIGGRWSPPHSSELGGFQRSSQRARFEGNSIPVWRSRRRGRLDDLLALRVGERSFTEHVTGRVLREERPRVENGPRRKPGHARPRTG